MSGPEGPPQQRSGMRTPVSIVCDIRVAHGAWQRVVLEDLSPEGFKVRETARARIGEDVWIRVQPLAPLLAEVRWVEHKMFGCKFRQPLAVYVFDHLVQTAQRL